MKKLLAFMTLAALLLASTVALADGVEDGLLRIAYRSDISTMDVAQTTDDYMIPMNIFDRLFEVEVRADGSSEIVPSLCESYTVSADGLTYDFTLRSGICFSNGEALTASDVRYTFERLLTAGGVNDDIPLEVLGARALEDGTADSLEGFVVTDDLHFSITLEKANAGFLSELTSPAMSILDCETTSAAANFGISCEETVGTGAYRVTEWVVNDHYTLEYNEKYWGEEPSVKKVIVSIIPDASAANLMFQNGELDILDLEQQDPLIVTNTYKTQYADKIVYANRVGMWYLALNEQNEYLADVNVRKAIRRAIDVDSIIEAIYMGDATAENGIIPTGVWGHNEALERPTYDPDAAKQILTDAGYAEGQIYFELAWNSSFSSNAQLVYQVIQANLKAIGIDVTIANYDDSSWLDLRKSGSMDAYVNNWTMDYNDPANIMYTFFGSEANAKIRSLNYSDTDVMARVAAASGIVDDETRKAEYCALEEKIVVEDAAWMPLFAVKRGYALGERVEAFTPYWSGFTDFYARLVTLK